MRAASLSILLGTCCLLCGLTACDDGPTEPSTASHIRGLVVDADGLPVAGAGILMSYRPSFGDLLVGNRPAKDLPDPQPLSIVVTRWCVGDTIAVLVAGHVVDVQWNGRNRDGEKVVEGVYVADAVDSTGAVLATQELVYVEVWYDDATTEEHREFFARTGADGRFHFSQECLPFGHVVTTTDEAGNVIDDRPITRWVDLWAVTDEAGVCAHVDSVEVHEWAGIDINLQLPREAP